MIFLSFCISLRFRNEAQLDLVSRASRIFPRVRMRVRKWAGEGKEKYVWADLPGFLDTVECAECLPRLHNVNVISEKYYVADASPVARSTREDSLAIHHGREVCWMLPISAEQGKASLVTVGPHHEGHRRRVFRACLQKIP